MDIDIIDSHLHVYDLALRSQFPNQNWSHSFPSEENESSIVYDVPQTLAKSVANESGVKKVVFVMCFDDCPEEAQWVYDNAQTTDLIIGIVAGLDLTKHEKLRHYIQKFRLEFKAPKFVGIRHHICFNEDLLFSDAFQKGLEILEELKVPFDLGINHTILKHVPTLAKKFPTLKMVIDHLAKPEVPKGEEYLRVWKREISELAKFPNVFMKLSGLVVLAEPWNYEMFQPYVEHCITELGSNRCMFGSDWPVCRLAKNTDYPDVLELLQKLTNHLSYQDRKNIFRDTVVNYYGLNE